MTTDAASASAAAIRLRGVGRRFANIVALDGVDLDVRPGEVHAIVGENGAGKSTCLSILAGRILPSDGTVEFFGRSLPLGDPGGLRKAGVCAIYQELTIIPELSTQANVFLGQDRTRRGVIREGEMRRRLQELAAELDVNIVPDVPAGRLSVSDQQLVEIMRALVSEPRVILFDEPTAALAPHEREVLHRVIRRLRESGVTIVFVSHNLDEVLDLSDEITVFRNGRLVESRPANLWSKPELVESMIGRKVAPTDRRQATRKHVGHDPALGVSGLTTRRLRDLSFETHAGEIVGLAGLVGSGRTTLLKALAGDIPEARGQMHVRGNPVSWPTNTRKARRAGITMVPEDRKVAGLFHEMSAAENIAMGSIGSSSRYGVVSPRSMRNAADGVAAAMGFDVSRLGDPAGTLSGGNQQKLLLARAALSNPIVLLADEPTRGVDIGAKDEIMRTLRTMAEAGVSIVVVSSELEDLEHLCDRVIVLSGGEIAARLNNPQEITMDAMLSGAFRVEGAAA